MYLHHCSNRNKPFAAPTYDGTIFPLTGNSVFQTSHIGKKLLFVSIFWETKIGLKVGTVAEQVAMLPYSPIV